VLGSSDLIAFVARVDLGRAREFYASVLGLRLVEETPFACVFDANGTTLRVTLAESVTPAGYTVLGWSVADVAATIRALRERGVVFVRYARLEQDDLGVWRSLGGARIAWFEDPDGNTLSLSQL
jgi:catechol 2,3-dioxygenase-like lactoylglutathione lyase family enzyme